MYKIVDFKNANITSTETVIEGIYDKIEGTRKALLFKNVVIDDVEKHNAFVSVANVAGVYTAVIEGTTISIAADDTVKTQN